jgi:hypothetical protein
LSFSIDLFWIQFRKGTASSAPFNRKAEAIRPSHHAISGFAPGNKSRKPVSAETARAGNHKFKLGFGKEIKLGYE